MQEFIDAFIDPSNLAGHISYMLLIVSMLMRTMHWLRAFAISAGVFSAIYYISIGDPISFFWETIFTLVNATQLLILMIENRRGRFSADEQRFIDHVLKGVERAQIRRLMKLGAWTEVADGRTLFVEEEKPADLVYVVQGQAEVIRHGENVGSIGPGDFIGEMSYLSGEPATATVTTTSRVRYLAFEQEALRAYLGRNAEIRHAMEAGFNRNLVGKLAKTSSQLRQRSDKSHLSEDLDQALAMARSQEAHSQDAPSQEVRSKEDRDAGT